MSFGPEYNGLAKAKSLEPRETTMKRTGSQILWESLVREGVTDVFGYPGGAILPAYDAMLDYPIRHVLVRHEQGATHMAARPEPAAASASRLPPPVLVPPTWSPASPRRCWTPRRSSASPGRSAAG